LTSKIVSSPIYSATILKYYPISRSFIKTILYFDIFSYPLLEEEVVNYCNVPGIDPLVGRKVLESLKKKHLINYYKGYYFAGTDNSIVDKRIEDNQRADRRMKAARIFTRIISNFPYVRAVFISGSLSKHVMKNDSDIDFFIITESGRLWFCKALLTIFKKIVLINSHRNFCLNYFIDTNTLSIPDRNIYTATEIAFLLPMYNYLLYCKFLDANNWYRYDYPNRKEINEMVHVKPFGLKYFFEFACNNFLGIAFDQLSYKVLTGFWKKKYNYLGEKKYSRNIQSSKNVSKFHPDSYQERVLDNLERKIREFEFTTGFLFSDSMMRKSAIL
jgi:hypothetical protein